MPRAAPERPPPRLAEPLDPEEAEVYAALVVGLRDYVEKNGFEHVVLGLSGGIDSALVALIAADALGPERVRCVDHALPPLLRGDPRGRAEDRRATSVSRLIELPDRDRDGRLRDVLRPALAGENADPEAPGDARASAPGPDVTAENMQARIRGNLVMALSNRFGWLVLTTGNKSELSVGYATLYGDMAGGFAVIKDVPKTLVYALVRWRNVSNCRAPASSSRPPWSSARRRPSCGQTSATRTRCPPYESLDRILEAYVERDREPEQIAADGIDRETRRRGDPDGRPRRVQAPPGPARDQDLAEGVRARPPTADHEPVRALAPTAGATASTIAVAPISVTPIPASSSRPFS